MKQIKYFRILIFAILVLCLNGCGNDTHSDGRKEYSETIVQENKRESGKSKSSGFGTFIALVGLGVSGYCLYVVKSMNDDRKLKLKEKRYQAHTHINDHNNEVYEHIINKMRDTDKNIGKISADITNLKEEISVLKSKDMVRTPVVPAYSSRQREIPVKETVNNSSYNNAYANKFKDVVEEYNYYINNDIELKDKFEKLNFQAKNNELFPKDDGEALLYIITGDASDMSNDKIYYIFPSKRIRERRVQGFVCDAFEIVGDGSRVRVSTPCSVRKMSTKYEIIEKGKVYLE